MGTITLEPMAEAFRCAVELPSACLKLLFSANALRNPKSISCTTSGSAFSLMVRPAVVCGQKTRTYPSLVCVSVTHLCTFCVMGKKASGGVAMVNDCNMVLY